MVPTNMQPRELGMWLLDEAISFYWYKRKRMICIENSTHFSRNKMLMAYVVVKRTLRYINSKR